MSAEGQAEGSNEYGAVGNESRDRPSGLVAFLRIAAAPYAALLPACIVAYLLKARFAEPKGVDMGVWVAGSAGVNG